MPIASGKNELWRRLALLIGVLAGLGLFFFVAPAMISVTAVDWEQEQAKELKSSSGFVSAEHKRLSQLPLKDYIYEKTNGQVTHIDAEQWQYFFQQVQLASFGQYSQSVHGNRVSEEDKDDFWKPSGPVQVFFKPWEIPFEQWGLTAQEDAEIYISTTDSGRNNFFLVSYENYWSSVTAMSTPYRTPPDWLFHPYRLVGIGFLVVGLLLYILLPRRRRSPEDIGYAAGRLVAGDIVALIILVPFYGLPFLINGGTVQSITEMWPISLIMWCLAASGVLLLYFSAWYASYRIELTPTALYLITFKGVQECRYNELTSVELVSLRNPGWFRKLFIALAMFSFLGGRSSTQPVGSALLAASAAYGGLELRGRGKPIYIWFTDQMGGTIVNNFDRVPEALRAAGIQINQESREIEGFSMFM